MKKRKKLLLIITTLLLIGILFWISYYDIKYYISSRQLVFWTNDVILKPADFQGEIDLNSDSNLYYYYGLLIKSTFWQDVEIKAVFDKNKSWIKDNTDFNNQDELQQLTFDLYEIYANECTNRIKKMDYFNDSNKSFTDLRNLVKSMHKDLNIVVDSLQSPNQNLQNWRKKVDSLLTVNK